MSRVVRKPVFCICENKDADQLRGNGEADQRLCFRYTDITISLLPKYEISSLQPFLSLYSLFVRDLVGNPEDRFSHNEAHMNYMRRTIQKEKKVTLAFGVRLRVHKIGFLMSVFSLIFLK